MRTPAHSKLRLVLAARVQAWRALARNAYDKSAEQSSVTHPLDYRAAALQEAADEVEAILTDDINNGEAV